MYSALLQVLLAAVRSVCQSAIRIVVYTFIVRILRQYFGLHLIFAIVCSSYLMSKILGYVQRYWFFFRLKYKKPEDRLSINEFTWVQFNRTNHKQFEIDWKQLIDDDTKHIFSSIVDIPFHSGWLYFLSFIYIDYYSDSYDFKCFLIILRVLSVLIVLISGSAIRYQTLLNRERDHLIDLIAKNPNDFERYIVYSGTKQPLASVCLQNHPVPEYRVFVIHLYQLNSKYTDYFYDIANYTCQRLIARLEVDGNERERNIHLVWPIATCKKSWTYAVRANKFYLRTTYKDFSFMPLVNSEIEQFEYIYDYKSRTNKIRKDQ